MLFNSLLAAFASLSSLAAAQTYTFQTSPASGDILRTNAGLVVRWENRAGNSPDSPSVASPAMVTVSLGYRKGEIPTVLYPPISGPNSDVPTASGSWVWQTMNFSGFYNGPAPARDMKTEWFIRLSDQSTGYTSNGQVFKILEATTNPAEIGAAQPPPTNFNVKEATSAVPNASVPTVSTFTSSGTSGANVPNSPASGATSANQIAQGQAKSTGVAINIVSTAILAPLAVAVIIF